MFKRSKSKTPTLKKTKSVSYNVWLLIGCQFFNAAPLVLELTWWMLSILSLCLLWQVLIAKKLTAQPNKVLVGILSISGCLLLVITGKDLGLLSTMIHLVTLSYVLKAFEQRNRADFYQIALLGMFVITASLIFQQSLYFALAIAVVMVFNLALVSSVFSPSLSVSKQMNLSLKVLLQSIPLTVFIFVVFPKLSPLWEVPVAKSAKTGLSDSVKVGDIANLALSNELAFRVTFKNTTPSYSSMYWRAIVMEHFDGVSWETKIEQNEFHNKQFNETVTYSTQGKSIDYQVIISPTYQKWLFGLDVARVNYMETKGVNIVHRQDYSLFSVKPITQNSSYSVKSYIESPLAPNITDYSIHKNLVIPEGNNPRLVEKAEALRDKYPDTRELIKHVLTTFTDDTYRYTLNPPRLNNNSLDEFYFDTKAGFCEHYASSFTFMMRAAGVPARMVTGYMGGEYNPQGGYFSIYQRDAHAWSEVWLRGKGWVRVDPTAAINPERVERGFSDSLLSEQANFSDDKFSLLRMSNNAWVNQIRLQIEALDYNWTRWVIGYTAEKQNKLLQNLMHNIMSLKNLKWTTIAYYMLVLASVLFIGWLIVNVRKARQPVNATDLYQSLVSALQKQGINKTYGYTPHDLNNIVKQALPELSFEFARFTQLYSSLMYKPLNDDERDITLKSFKQSYQVLSKQVK